MTMSASISDVLRAANIEGNELRLVSVRQRTSQDRGFNLFLHGNEHLQPLDGRCYLHTGSHSAGLSKDLKLLAALEKSKRALGRLDVVSWLVFDENFTIKLKSLPAADLAAVLIVLNTEVEDPDWIDVWNGFLERSDLELLEIKGHLPEDLWDLMVCHLPLDLLPGFLGIVTPTLSRLTEFFQSQDEPLAEVDIQAINLFLENNESLRGSLVFRQLNSENFPESISLKMSELGVEGFVDGLQNMLVQDESIWRSIWDNLYERPAAFLRKLKTSLRSETWQSLKSELPDDYFTRYLSVIEPDAVTVWSWIASRASGITAVEERQLKKYIGARDNLKNALRELVIDAPRTPLAVQYFEVSEKSLWSYITECWAVAGPESRELIENYANTSQFTSKLHKLIYFESVRAGIAV